MHGQAKSEKDKKKRDKDKNRGVIERKRCEREWERYKRGTERDSRLIYIDQPSDVFNIDYFVWLEANFFSKLFNWRALIQNRTGSWVLPSLYISTSINIKKDS